MTMTWLKRCCVVMLLVLGLGLQGASAADQPQTLNYKQLLKGISEQRGKVVIVQFFASWCQPCLKEIPEIIAMRKSYDEDKVAILGVSIDEDAAKLGRLVSSTQFNYPIYLASADVSTVFQVSAIPKIMVYSKEGKLAMNHTGWMPTRNLQSLVDGLLK